MGTSVDNVMKRFIRLIKDGEDVRKLQSIMGMISKQDLTEWTDSCGLDALHYAVIAGNVSAVDCLLKLGYFTSPYEPRVNMYAHLAARLGYRTVLTTILQYRPEDFKVVEQPLLIPWEFKQRSRTSCRHQPANEPGGLLPVVLGVQVTPESSRSIVFAEKSNLRKISNVSTAAGPSCHPETTSRRRSSQSGANFVMSGSRRSFNVNRPEQGGDTHDQSRRSSSPTDALGFGHHDTRNVPTHGLGCFSLRRCSRDLDRHTNSRSNSTTRAMRSNPFLLPTNAVPRRESLPKEKPKKVIKLSSKRRNSSPEDSCYHPIDLPDPESLKPLKCTPLEVAAQWAHLDCVKTLLDMYILRAYPELGMKGYLTLASLANDVPSLKLLLSPTATKSQGTSFGREAIAARKEDYRTAVEVCVHNVFPECLDLLLEEALVDNKMVFKQVNFFHVLYSSPKTTYKRVVSLSRLPALTQLLIERGHDVKARLPSRTYPLYSLIHNAFCTFIRNDFFFSECFIACMMMLMENGADPNFDEVEFERKLSVTAQRGNSRHAYTSGLHCVLRSMERYRTEKPKTSQIIHFVEECIENLIVHGADIEKIGRLNGNGNAADEVGDVLFQFAKSSVTIGLDRGLLRCLVRFGVQPQRKINGQYALNVYFNQVCAVLGAKAKKNENGTPCPKEHISAITSLMCSYMAPWHIKDVQKIFNLKHKNCTHDEHKEFVHEVNEELDREGTRVHTLRNITAWQVWKLCGRRAENIKALPVSKEIRMTVLPLLLFQMMW